MGVRQNKALVLFSLLLGFGIGTLLTLPSAPYTEERAVAMAASPMQASKAAQRQFLKPSVTMIESQSLTKQIASLPPQQKLMAEKEIQKEANVLLKTIAGAGGLLAGPHAAHAATATPSLVNLGYSVLAGTVVVLVAAGALLVVSNLDPVDRS